jgi:hypothetical protein
MCFFMLIVAFVSHIPPTMTHRNQVVLMKIDHGGLGKKDVTENEKYFDVVSLIYVIRRQLLINKHYRNPYLNLLYDLYDFGSPKTQAKIQHLRPTRPTDIDVCQFFWSQWPEIRLARKQMSGTSFEWGFTVAGSEMAWDNAVNINSTFVSHLRKKAGVVLFNHH